MAVYSLKIRDKSNKNSLGFQYEFPNGHLFPAGEENVRDVPHAEGRAADLRGKPDDPQPSNKLGDPRNRKLDLQKFPISW